MFYNWNKIKMTKKKNWLNDSKNWLNEISCDFVSFSEHNRVHIKYAQLLIEIMNLKKKIKWNVQNYLVRLPFLLIMIDVVFSCFTKLWCAISIVFVDKIIWLFDWFFIFFFLAWRLSSKLGGKRIAKKNFV